jgi:hypothetical protein
VCGSKLRERLRQHTCRLAVKGNQLLLVTFFFRHLAAIARTTGERSSSQDMSAGVKIDHIAPRYRCDVAR